MIQRIQSFLLVLAAVCVALLFMFPVATYTAEPGPLGNLATSELNLFPKSNGDLYEQVTTGTDVVVGQSETAFHSWPLVVLAFATGVIALVSIFLYRNRIVQMRVVAGGFLLNVVYLFLVFLWATDSYARSFCSMAASVLGDVTPVHTVYSVGAFIPIVSLVLLFLAQRAIRSDEMKVRAADRLR